MFRIGSLLFIPGYLTVTLYRLPFASEEEDGNFALMAGLAFSTLVFPLWIENRARSDFGLICRALRFCGGTFAYTSISILLNYSTCSRVLQSGWAQFHFSVTPPHAVGLANGIAQSIVSLARCFGPILGGLVRSSTSFLWPSTYIRPAVECQRRRKSKRLLHWVLCCRWLCRIKRLAEFHDSLILDL